jgi:hypothetical protein
MPLDLLLRSEKGSALTIEELDANWTAIMAWVAAFEADPTPPNGIANIVQEGTQLTIFLDDATELGPFTLPSATAITPVVEKSASSFTLASEDRSTYMRCTNVAGCTITVPLNSEDPIPIHSEFHFRQCTAGGLIFEAPTDVTINGIDGFGLATDTQGAVVTLKKVDDDEWDIFGLLAEETTASA